MTAQLKAVLFDMDDTLLDWSTRGVDWQEHERLHLQYVLDYVVRDVHPVSSTPEAFFEAVRHHARAGWQEAETSLRAPNHALALKKGLIAVGVPAEQIDIDACLDAYNWQMIRGVRLFPEVPDVLGMLAAHGIALGLVTNASVPMRLRDRELEAVGLLTYFSECRFAAVDVGYIKPHPAIFEHALNCLSIDPAEAVFVGDNPEADIAGAQRVGMRAVLRRIGHRAPEPVNGDIRPDGTVDTLEQLLPLLDGWYPGWRSVSRPEASAVPGSVL
jgi:HAD superfamily hydrolase (TIGR01662 family)